jgi:hypothetical protein
VAYRPNPVGWQPLVDGEAAWEQTQLTAISIWDEGRQEAHRSSVATVIAVRRRGAPVRGGGQPTVVGLVGEVSEHLRARAMLLTGSMGLEEHRRRLSTVASEAEEAVAGEELAPGPEVLGASSSKVLRGEEKVGVWFLGSDDDGVVGKGGNGESRAERLLREEEGRHLPWTDSTTGDTWGGDCMRGAWSGCGGWSAAPV